MEIVYNNETLKEYMDMATDISSEHPVLIDKYIKGKEIEVDGICDGKDVLIPGIMEHIEKAGVHSGDSIAIYPPQTLDIKTQNIIVAYTKKLGKALNIKGLFNIQFVIDENNKVYVIEVNPRASRTIPVMSKITGIPMVNIATKLIMGITLKQLGYKSGLVKSKDFIAVKAPVFSFSKLSTLDTFLGPEMKSTGEVMGVAKTYKEALYKAFLAAGLKMPLNGNVLVSIANQDKESSLETITTLHDKGYNIYATNDTFKFLIKNNIDCTLMTKNTTISEIKLGNIDFVINTPTRGKIKTTSGFLLRRTSIEYDVPCITNIDTAKAALSIINYFLLENNLNIYSLDEYSKEEF